MDVNKMKQTQYVGNSVFKVNLGLYGFDDINFEETRDSLIEGFEEKFETEIITKLMGVGLKLVELKWFSPKEYNFDTNSIDPVIIIVDKNLLKKSIIAKKDIINQQLSLNKSSDGYMALTVENVDEELDKLEQDYYEVDTIVLRELLDLDCSDFDISDYLVYEDETEVEE